MELGLPLQPLLRWWSLLLSMCWWMEPWLSLLLLVWMGLGDAWFDLRSHNVVFQSTFSWPVRRPMLMGGVCLGLCLGVLWPA